MTEQPFRASSGGSWANSRSTSRRNEGVSYETRPARHGEECPSGSDGSVEATERALQRAEELGDACADAELHLGIRLSRKGLWRDAVPHFRRSIELEGEQAPAYTFLGEALNCTDDLSGALSAFEKAQQLDPNNERALRGLGVVCDRLGRSEEAVEMYHRSREGGVGQ